jgi:SAM-dependent methyltransferase
MAAVAAVATLAIMRLPLAAPESPSSTRWFESWFDSIHYQKLYSHRDHTEAIRFVDALVGHLKPAPEASMVDLGCGAGRHARRLAEKGFDVTGLDLSASSIEAARQSAHRRLRFRRHDMRVPFGTTAFDYVFNFFTSFGYFDDAAEQDAVVRNIARSLRPGGHLVLDYLNVGYADARMTPEETRDIDGTCYRIRRWTDGRRFFKRIVVDDGRGGEPLVYREQVARFSLADFQRLLLPQGLEIVELYGDYRLGAYDAKESPRLVLIAKKGPAGRKVELPAREVLTDATDGFRRDSQVRGEHPLRHALRQ